MFQAAIPRAREVARQGVISVRSHPHRQKPPWIEHDAGQRPLDTGGEMEVADLVGMSPYAITGDGGSLRLCAPLAAVLRAAHASSGGGREGGEQRVDVVVGVVEVRGDAEVRRRAAST